MQKSYHECQRNYDNQLPPDYYQDESDYKPEYEDLDLEDFNDSNEIDRQMNEMDL
jgi:hypothetical protein